MAYQKTLLVTTHCEKNEFIEEYQDGLEGKENGHLSVILEQTNTGKPSSFSSNKKGRSSESWQEALHHCSISHKRSHLTSVSEENLAGLQGPIRDCLTVQLEGIKPGKWAMLPGVSSAPMGKTRCLEGNPIKGTLQVLWKRISLLIDSFYKSPSICQAFILWSVLN